VLVVLLFILVLILALYIIFSCYYTTKNLSTQKQLAIPVLDGGVVMEGINKDGTFAIDGSAMLHQVKHYLNNISINSGYIAVFDVVVSHTHTYTTNNIIHLVIHRRDNNRKFYAMDIILLAAIHELAHVIRNRKPTDSNCINNSSHDASHDTNHDDIFNDIETKLIEKASAMKYINLNWLANHWRGDSDHYPCFKH